MASEDVSTLGDRIYRLMRSDILMGRLPPGRKLKLDGMKSAYGAGVSTLRELLSRLSSEGLVVAEGQRGFEVASVSAGNFREVAELRLFLENHALQLAFAAGDMEWEGRVVAAHHKLSVMEKRMLAGDRSEAETWKRYDREFHQALISACGSRALLAAHERVYDKYLRYQMIAVVFRGEIAAGEHARLLDVALRRDHAAAQRILADHIRGCVDDTLTQGALGESAPAPRPLLSPLNVRSDTTGEKAYRLIRADILMGRLAPGEKLKLDRLNKRYDVSVSTLREILNRLSSEELVLAEGQRGFEVTPVSQGNLREIAALRLLLERHALEQSFATGGVEWEGQVVAAHHKLAVVEARMKAGDIAETENWKRYDWQFHQALIAACGSEVLMETHAAIFDRYLRYQMLTLGFRGDIAINEHAALLDCALRRDADRAARILDLHVAGGVEQALEDWNDNKAAANPTGSLSGARLRGVTRAKSNTLS